MAVKISVIVPVYNVEKYLDRCIKSLINQSFKDFEVIFTDDGSKDKSLDILKHYCAIYENFRLISLREKTNVSDCRNRALKKAKGEYIAFADSDDYVERDFLRKLYKKAKETNADIVSCGFYIEQETTLRRKKKLFRLKNGEYYKPKILKLLIKDTKINYYIWNKLFRKGLLTDNNIDFPEMLFEDAVFCVKAVYFANKVAVIPDMLYYYVQHKKSLVHTLNDRKINDYIKALAYTRIFLESKNTFSDYKISFKVHSLRIFFVSLKDIFLFCKNSGSFSGFWENISKATKIIIYLNSKKASELKSFGDYSFRIELKGGKRRE